MKTIRKFIAGMTAALCMLSLLSFTPAASVAYAAEDGDWEYTIADSKVTITKYKGTGEDVEIPDMLGGYEVSSIGTEAFNDCKSMTNITLPLGLKTIEQNAFNLCENLSSIIIPDTVTSIAQFAFSQCYHLKSVTLPASITKIENGTFKNCCNLGNIQIPQGVISIGAEAFATCFDKADVLIPASVTSIAGNAFSECNGLASFTVDAANPNYSSEDGVLFNKDKTNLILCPAMKSGDYSIPSSVVKIESNAFWCGRLNTVSLPEGLTTIGDGAFTSCYGLYSVTLPTSLTAIGVSSFSGCSNLASISLPESLTSIGNQAFEACIRLQSVNLPDNLVSIGDYAFAECYNLASIGSIPRTVSSIGDKPFSGCMHINGFTVDSDNPYFCTDAGIIYNISKTSIITCPTGISGTVTIPQGVTEIPAGMFYECTFIRSVILPSSIKDIGSIAFAYCSSITDITLPNGVISIGSTAFGMCKALIKINLPGSVTTIDSDAFMGCESLDNIVLDSTNISYCLYDDMLYSKDLKELILCPVTKSGIVQIPAETTKISETFNNCPLITGFDVSEDNPEFSYVDGVITSKDKTSLLICPGGKSGVFNIDQSCSYIDFLSFEHNNKITEFTVDEENMVFSSIDGMLCDKEGYSLLFCPKGKQGNAIIPNTVQYIDQGSFRRCNQLETINVDSGNKKYKSIGGCLYTSSMLIACPGAKRGVMQIADGTMRVEPDAIFGCPEINSLIISDTVSDISNIGECDKLKNVYFLGNAPSLEFSRSLIRCNLDLHVYYVEGKTGFGSMWYGYPASTFDPNASFSVTYDTQGGSALSGSSAKFASTIQKPDDPEKVGYALDGWYMEPECVNHWDFQSNIITEDTTIYAGWIATNRTVTFESNGGSAVPSQTVPNSSTFSAPTAPTREHFVFAGWYKEVACENAWDFAKDKVITDMTLYAKWDIAKYIVNFDCQGGSPVADQMISYKAMVTEPIPQPIREGYTFRGWCKEESCVNLWSFTKDTVTMDTTLYAKWEINVYKVAFDSQGGSYVGEQSIIYSSYAMKPASPSKTGHTFYGWYKEAACENAWDFTKDKVRADVTLYAKWDINKYKVSFDTMGGAPIASQTVEYGASVASPDSPRKAGFACVGWYTNEAYTDKWNFTTDKVKSNMTLYAKWSPNRYTVSFVSRGGSSIASQPAYYGSTVEQPPVPTRKGYAFTGWFRNDACTNSWDFESDLVEGDMALYAGWSINTYTVQFNSKGGNPVTSMTAEYGVKIAAPAEPDRPYYDFLGWFSDSSCTKQWNFSIDTVQGDLILYAKWVAQASSAYLAGITASAGTLNRPFSASVYKYTLNLGENESGATVILRKLYDGAAVTINGRKAESRYVPLANGKKTTLTIRLKSGRAAKTYTLVIQRAKSTNNRLASLSASAGTLSPAFNPYVSDYKLLLPEGTGKATITARKASALARTNALTQRISLRNGQTKTIKITVKAQSGASRTYRITVTRAKSTNANLSKISTNARQSPLSPKFSANVSGYSVVLPANKSTVTLNWRVADRLAKVYINGKARASVKLTLKNGQSTDVTIVVAAQAGNTRTYTVTVRRP